MNIAIRSPRKLLTGLFFLAVAGFHFWQGQSLRLGTLNQMGPGMFPLMLEIALAVLGLASIATALRVDGEALPALGWREAGTIIGAVVVFGVLTPLFGIVVGLSAAVVLAGSASHEATIVGIAGLVVVLVSFCLAVFVWGIGIPVRLFAFPGL
jgi:hypothetical protein